MADNVTIPATGTGTATPVVATDDVASVHYQRIKNVGGADGTATRLDVAEDEASAGGDLGIAAMARRTDTPANQSGTDGDWEALQVSGGKLWVAPLGYFVTVSHDLTRPADTTAYTNNDQISNSTSAPVAMTFTGAARKSGGSGIITDLVVLTDNDPATTLQAELYLYDSSVTLQNDNSAWTMTDADQKKLVGVIPFTLTDVGANDVTHIQGLNIGFTCVGSADLRGSLRAKNAYTPANAEVITFRLKILQID